MDIPTNYQALKAVPESYRAKLSQMDYEAKMQNLISITEAHDQNAFIHRQYREDMQNMLQRIKQRIEDNPTENPRIIMHSTLVEALRDISTQRKQAHHEK